MLRSVEETLIDLGYLRSDPEIDFNNIEQLVKVIRQETLIECISIAHENQEAGCPMFTVPQLKKLLNQIK